MYLPTLRASSLRLARRSASTGLKYEALAVGVPKETFPLEKRCAALLDLSEALSLLVEIRVEPGVVIDQDQIWLHVH